MNNVYNAFFEWFPHIVVTLVLVGYLMTMASNLFNIGDDDDDSNDEL